MENAKKDSYQKKINASNKERERVHVSYDKHLASIVSYIQNWVFNLTQNISAKNNERRTKLNLHNKKGVQQKYSRLISSNIPI